MNAFPIGYLKMAYVPISEMKIDTAYQRVATRKVDKIASEWNREKCDPISLSYRDGWFYITDGQHRFLAADRNNETHLPAIIRTGLTQIEEALIFVSQNDNVSKLTPYDTFKGNLLIGDKTDMAINDICNKYNVLIEKTQTQGKNRVLGSISEARGIVKTYGSECFEWILKIIRASGWLDEKGAFSTYIIRTLKSCYVNNQNNLDSTGKLIVDIFEKKTPLLFKAEATVEYMDTSDIKSACTRYLQKLIKDEYIKQNNIKVMSKDEFRARFAKENKVQTN
jgi:hypothetical protein